MVRKNGSKNLFIKQGDNSNLDLFMQSPEFIKDFTNWETKNSSLEVTRSRAFEKTPFDNNAEEMTPYTNIEIGNNVALCADENYSTSRFGNPIFPSNRSNPNQKGYYLKTTIMGFPDNDHYTNDVKLSKVEESAIVIKIDTIAGASELHFDTCRTPQNKRKLAYCIPRLYDSAGSVLFDGVSNPAVGIIGNQALNRFQDVWAQNLDIGEVARRYTGIGGDTTITVLPYSQPRYNKNAKFNYYSCAEDQVLHGIGGISAPNNEVASAAEGLIYKDDDDGFVYFLDLNRLGPDINIVNKDLAYFAIPGTSSNESRPLSPEARSHIGKDGIEVAAFEFQREGSYEIKGLGLIKDPEYKVQFFECEPNFVLFDVTRAEGCGRVDIFKRRSGTLTVNASTNKVSFRSNSGVVLSSTPQVGDVIKIVSGLNESTGSSNINPVNGVFYLGADFKLYANADFSEEVNLRDIRGTAKWTLMDSANSEDPTSRWQYHKSIIGSNTPSQHEVTTAASFDSSLDVQTVQSFNQIKNKMGLGTGNDELTIRDKNFNLGKAIAIRKSDDAIAISQPANHFNSLSEAQLGLNLYGNTTAGLYYFLDMPLFFIEKDHKLNNRSYDRGFKSGNQNTIQRRRDTDTNAYGFTGNVREPSAVEAKLYFDGYNENTQTFSNFDFKPISITNQFTDLCEEDKKVSDTAPDDPTGVTYGEDGDFSTPMSEPVVSTDGDNVDFYNYGDPNAGTSGGDIYGSEGSEMFSDPDGAFSGFAPLVEAVPPNNDHTTNARSVFKFELNNMNYGCVFFGYVDDDLVSIDASSGNTLIAPPSPVGVGGAPANDFLSSQEATPIDQLHWRKAWALGKRQLDTVTFGSDDSSYYTVDIDGDNIAETNDVSKSPIYFEITAGRNGKYNYNAYDMRKFRNDTVDSNLWFQHPECIGGYRAPYTAYWGKFDKCTDGFGQAVAFGDNGEIFIADSTSHYSGPCSVLGDMLMYEYSYSEPRRDTQPQYPYYNDGDDLAEGERISTRKQPNKPLQDFADSHSRSMKDVLATEEYNYRSVYSVHIKIIRDQDELLSGDLNNKYATAQTALFCSSQTLPYSAGDLTRKNYLVNTSLKAINGGGAGYALKGTRVPDTEQLEYVYLSRRYGLPPDFPFYRLSPYSPNVIVHYDSGKLYVSNVSGFVDENESTASRSEFRVDGLGQFRNYTHGIKVFDFSEGKTDYWLAGCAVSTELFINNSGTDFTDSNENAVLYDAEAGAGTSDSTFNTALIQDPRLMIWPGADVANLSVGHLCHTALAGRDFSGLTGKTDVFFSTLFSSNINMRLFSGKFKVSPFTMSFANGEFWPVPAAGLPSSISYANGLNTWTYIMIVKPNQPIGPSDVGNLVVPVSDDEVEVSGFSRLRKNKYLIGKRKGLFSSNPEKNFRYCNVSSPYYITDPWCTEEEQQAQTLLDKVVPNQVPVGQNRDFRVDRGTLVFLQENTTDEFGLIIPESRQLVIYDVSTNNPKLIQKTTATLPSDIGRGVRANISLDDSTTSTDVIADFISVDICNGKIFTSIMNSFRNNTLTSSANLDYGHFTDNGWPEAGGFGNLTNPAFAIFTDTGRSRLPRSETLTEFSEPAFPFLTFAENFSDVNPYNLNNIYEYIRNEGTFINSQIFDINNSHRNPLAFYSMRNFSKDGQAMVVPIGITVTVDVDTNFTSPNENVVLPKVAFYDSDPRLNIRQIGEVSDGKLLFGEDTQIPSRHSSLYTHGAQNARNMSVLTPTYRFTGGRYKGTIDIDFNQDNSISLFEYKELSAEDNRTFRFNDGNGNCFLNELDAYGRRKPASYTFEFDDANKESFNRGFLRGNNCIGLGLLSWETNGDDDDAYRKKSTSQQNRYSPYTKYKVNDEEPHSFVNTAKISVVVKYKEYDTGLIRRFSCAGDVHIFNDPNVNYDGSPFPLPVDLLVSDITPYLQGDPESSSKLSNRVRVPNVPYTIRTSKSDAQPYLNQSSAVLAGTETHSIQVVAPQLAFDNPNPDFLSLAIRNIPTENNNADLSTTGHINSSGNMDLRISGIVTEQGAMTIHLGEVLKNAAMDINMPNVIGFECDGVALSLLPPTGTQVEKTTSLVFPGGTGVSDGLSLSVNPTYTSGAFDFYVQGGLASGNMDIAMSGVHGIINTMPCVEGDLFLQGMTGPSSGIMPLHINRFSHSGDMTLVIDSANSSGIMPLAIGAEPMSASGVLFTEGYEDVNRATTLYIGRQFEEKQADLSISGPIPFEGDPITLHASGAAVNSVDTNDFNFDYMCHLTRTEDRFDFSQNSELVIPETKSNSISRNTHLPGSSARYGYYSPLSPGKRLNNFTQSSAKIFYDQELSREAIASNRDLLVVGSNPSALSSETQSLQIFEYIDEDSLQLKFTYDHFFRDLVRLSGISGGDGQISIRHKSIDVSDDNRIAVSVRISNKSGLRDAVCVLQPGKFVLKRIGQPTYDLCAIEPSYSTPVSIEEVDGWVMTQAIVGDTIDDSSDLVKCNNYIGNTVQWKDKDLYYDKQSKNYGSVYYIQYSDNYATENLAFSFGSTDDGQVYYSNRYNIPEGTKVGFGSRFKIHGDYAVVSAPLLDSFIANNDLSVMHAPSPEGAVYVYRFDSGWNFVDAIYSGGYTSSDISGISDCTYNHALFGYSVDVNKDSGFVAVSEPVTNKIYKYVIHANDTVSLVRDYTDSTSAGFGNKINICANSILTSNAEAIKEPVFGHDFQFTPEESVAETNQYNPFTSVTKSVSSTFTFVLDIEPKGAKRLLVGRSFNVNFAAEPTINIEKLSILNRGNYGNLFIQGPITSNSNKDIIYYRPLDVETNTMGLQFASIGVNSGIPLHVHVPDPASGVIPLHLRQAERADTTLFISHVFTPASGVTSLSTLGPLTSASSGDLFSHGAAAENNNIETFILGGRTGDGGMAQAAFNMRVAQADPIASSGDFDLSLHGVVNTASGHFAANTAFVEGGLYAPAEGIIDFLHIQTDLKASVTGVADLAIAVDPAAGPSDGTFPVSVGGSGVSSSIGASKENTNVNLVIAATAPNSGVTTLVMHRKGISGGEELAADANLIVYNLTESANVDLAVSGANIALADMNIAISGVVGAPTGITPTYIRGYQD
tara:strand:- start:14679 stop:23975 length:9297 start_codon:yes stop_codon:yes gene_type:complete